MPNSKVNALDTSKSNARTQISVLIVTYNSATCIVPCVQSVLSQTGIEFEIIVVDNASQDGTVSRLQGMDCRVMANSENVGFGRANNQAFEVSHGDYLYLLNPDARLVGSAALAEFHRKMEQNPTWGIAGTGLLTAAGENGGPPATNYPGQRHVKRDFSTLPGSIAWVLGASMIIRRDVYETLGGFDPGFFLYAEEIDLCLRAREAGFVIGYIPEVVVEHIGGASEDPGDPYTAAARKCQSVLRFRQKHYSADDCAFLTRRDCRRARLRMIWHGLLARVRPGRSKAWEKHRQNRGIWEVSKKLFESNTTKKLLCV